jgi:hypothetical protein
LLRLGLQRSNTWRIVNGRDFGWEIAHEAVSRRPPISLDTVVARNEGYTQAAKVLDLSLVQGPCSVAPCQTPNVTIRNFFTAVWRWAGARGRRGGAGGARAPRADRPVQQEGRPAAD